MKLTILGSGTSVPHPHRSSPAFWLETEGEGLLLDIGPDAAHRMAEERLDWPNLSAIWISHFHLDHFGGLAPLLFSLKWAPQTQDRTKPLRIFGPRGLQQLVQTINDANNYRLLAQQFPIEITEVDVGNDFEIVPGVTASTMKTPHTAESLALRLTDKSATRFVYTSDTGFTEDLFSFAQHVDLLLIESSFRRKVPVVKHLELAEAMRVASECAPGKLVLTHLYPEWDGIDLAAEAQAFWPGKVVEAIDGLVIKV
jgi:ribonuclease BN (tRNA processing enzyme)